VKVDLFQCVEFVADGFESFGHLRVFEFETLLEYPRGLFGAGKVGDDEVVE